MPSFPLQTMTNARPLFFEGKKITHRHNGILLTTNIIGSFEPMRLYEITLY